MLCFSLKNENLKDWQLIRMSNNSWIFQVTSGSRIRRNFQALAGFLMRWVSSLLFFYMRLFSWLELLLTHFCFGVKIILECLEICTIVGFVTFAGEGYTMWDQGWSDDIFWENWGALHDLVQLRDEAQLLNVDTHHGAHMLKCAIEYNAIILEPCKYNHSMNT